MKKDPKLFPYSESIIDNIAAAIPKNVRDSITLHERKYPSNDEKNVQDAFIREFVTNKLDLIAKHEYRNWLSGHLPFVTPQELRLWRLQQFAQFIWNWCLPDDEVIEIILNLTKGQSARLVSDFYAKFQREIFPRMVRRLFEILKSPLAIDIEVGKIIGNIYRIPSKRYVTEMNIVVTELWDKIWESDPKAILYPAKIYKQNNRIMWVSCSVLSKLDEKNKKKILELYPIN